MSTQQPTLDVRGAGEGASVVDVRGELTAGAEAALMDAYARATSSGARTVVFNFSDLEYMNSSGIGLLVTLLIRAQRQGVKIAAFGLSEHYRDIFELTRLDEAIAIYGSEAEATAAS